jgi:nanoRNase/pAp phosphatase (c-di-AMP/oligoRNAs hydrolase)
MSQGEFSSIVTQLQSSESVLAVVHTHADADSVGSALALTASLDANVHIGVPTSMKANAEPLLELAEDAVVSEPDPSEYDVVVVLDAPTTDRVSPIDVLNDPETPS